MILNITRVIFVVAPSFVALKLRLVSSKLETIFNSRTVSVVLKDISQYGIAQFERDGFIAEYLVFMIAPS